MESLKDVPEYIKIALVECNSDCPTVAWAAFGKIWEWGEEQDWWDTLLTNHGRYNDNFVMFIDERLINPEGFAEKIKLFNEHLRR